MVSGGNDRSASAGGVAAPGGVTTAAATSLLNTEGSSLLYSRSASTLLNRLRPQNENVLSRTTAFSSSLEQKPLMSQSMSMGQLNTMRPKAAATTGLASTSHGPLASSASASVLPTGSKASPTKVLNKSISNTALLSTAASNMPPPTVHEQFEQKQRMRLAENEALSSMGLTSGGKPLDLPPSPTGKLIGPGMKGDVTQESQTTPVDGDDHRIRVGVPGNLNRQATSQSLLMNEETNSVVAGTVSGSSLVGMSVVTAEGPMILNRHSFLVSLDLTPKQLQDLFKVTHTFFYMRQRKIPVGHGANGDERTMSGSVYDLEVIPLEQVDKNNYFTLSKEGVTQFHGKTSVFTGLAQWEREYLLFHRISKITFFSLYKRWKAFTVWRKNLRYDKMAAAAKSLEENLFVFNLPLRRALLAVRNLTLPLGKLGILDLNASQTMDLSDFMRSQDLVHDEMRGQLRQLSSQVLSTVRSACDEVVDQFLKVNNIAANHKMTFMERAALRSECKKLTRFLRMIDILIGDFFKTMAQDSLRTLLSAVECTDLEPRVVIEDDIKSSKDLQSIRQSTGRKTPLFRVVADLHPTQYDADDMEEAIQLKPDLRLIMQQLDLVVDRIVDAAGDFVKVLASPETEMYVMPEGDTEDGEAVEADSIVDIIKNSEVFVETKENIEAHIKQAYISVKEFLAVFEPFRQLYLRNQENLMDISQRFPTGDVEVFQLAISEYRSQLEQFRGMPRFADVGVLFVDSIAVKQTMTPSPTECLSAICKYLPELVLTNAQSLLDEVGAINPVLAGEPSSVESYVHKKKMKDRATEQFETYQSRQTYIRTLINLMDDNGWAVPDQVKALMRMLKDTVLSLENNLQLAEGREEEEIKKFSLQVTDEVPRLHKKLAEFRELLDASLISDPTAADEKVCRYLATQETEFSRLKTRVEKAQEYQSILRLSVDDFELLEEIQSDLNLKVRFWNDKASWQSLYHRIVNSTLRELDADATEREMASYNKTATLAMKGLPLNKVVPIFKASIDEINPIIPLATDLLSDALKERHRSQIVELAGFNPFPPADESSTEAMTLKEMIARGITKYQEEISVIATAAQQEAILEKMLEKVTSLWDGQKFDVRPYKDVKDLYILGDTSEIVTNLEDSLVTINTILGSRYVAGIRQTVDNWRAKLMYFQEMLDEWLTCQRNWMYLETIFSSPDIIRQLPGPAKTFQTVDKSWKLIMKQTNDEPAISKAMANDRNQRRDLFRSHNANLDQIQKDLEDYLETKRMAFPRFYFLSNDELLEILSQTKDPRAVQPHLRKCFDNLVKLEFTEMDEATIAAGGTFEILSMFSGEGENVPLKPTKARGNVEEWLLQVERRMKEDLRLLMKKGVEAYDPDVRDVWVFNHPGQVVATVAQIAWASGTEKVLRGSANQEAGCEVITPRSGMLQWLADLKTQLQRLIEKIRGDLTKLHRAIIVALVTTDVHARDIIEELIERGVSSHHDFLWQQQLRYYWEVDRQDCLIRHSDAIVNYGYEYMGATSRLVITPLTDRCWLTLTGSYALKLGAAPAGPAGTGKTESSKDLAKAMGIQCVVFNCSDQIDYKMMGKLFRGLAQGGAWICLDEFNRIDIEVLSVIAQQMLVLREGRQGQRSTINFMGIQIPLVDHHVIITMNPGYAGRTELPDNLAVCFRPVSMMVPNYALIAEIMLFAEGFGDAKNLSRKMCKLYILCSEQLSQQPHYDYGLRAVKSVLVMAGSLKRANPTTPEDLVLIRALRDSNVPKFLADDLPLFAAIVQDLFPGVEIPSNDYGELQVALEAVLDREGLQKVPKFMNKVIQMFDIFNIRFGATLVGPAATGKTTCYRVLAAVMTKLREQGSKNPEFQKVRELVLNPKCITMGELYGEFNPLTQEWHDGLASSIMREFVAEDSDDRRWTVFDGPIDALWIENMNTVLDDNMTLCLANGQRIKLKSEMKCLFEVNDLAAASPATVSRIGVVYMTPSDLGWLPFCQTWLHKGLSRRAPAAARERIIFLFENVFGKGMAFQRKSCREPVVTVDMQLVMSMAALFQALFSEENGVDFSQPPADLLALLDKLFFFSYVWSVGVSSDASCWEQFSDHSRELFEESCPSLGVPDSGEVFDYFVDVSEARFRSWSETVSAFSYDEKLPYFSLIVPTVDSCRFSYVMRALITVDKPVFITGVTGTGKTVAVETLLQSLQAPVEEGGLNVFPIFMNFSAQTRSDVAQSFIENKLEKRRKNLLGPANRKRGVVFVDDVNMPLVETYGAQPPVELLRQFLDFKGFYDRDKLFWKDIVDVLLFVGAAPPGGGRSVVTPRFSRHFNVMSMPPASDSALTVIFSSILTGFLSGFEPEVQKLSAGAVAATIEVYQKISEELLPTPSKFHYTFNLRDISKVFQGLLMIRPRKCTVPEQFVRLWVHECMRIFYDRLINTDDQQWFQAQMVQLCTRHLRVPLSHDELFRKPIIFVDFIRPDADVRYYEDVRDLNKLTTVLDGQLDNYNVTFPSQMNLVFFEDALAHTARISRILRQPRGNAMLIGVGGSGKQSLTRMAAFVMGMGCQSIEIKRGYGIMEFREDLKKFMLTTGVNGKDLVFLFTDSQIIDETMLEDLNNVLNTGEVSNLWASDETDKIVADMIAVCKADGIPETRENCLAHFVSRVRDRLHIVLCMSPVGDQLRIRCRQFPSLINCTTIDWFHGWPEAALVSVAQRFLSDLELPNDDIRRGIVTMCGFVHRSIEDASERFWQELRRRVYTTPKSYLDLINLYMGMLRQLQDVVETRSDRMKVGVAKLNETNSLVDGLKKELIAMEPVLKEKAIQTAALLTDVERQKAEAAVVAAVVGREEEIAKKQADATSIVAAEAAADLDKVQPALDAAASALGSLQKADITEVRGFSNPPNAVKVVMEAVCVLVGVPENWDSAKRLLSRSDFLTMLMEFDKDNIPESRLKKLRRTYINADELKESVISQVSKAGAGLATWVRAMDMYSAAFKDVAPKRARLEEMNTQLVQTMSELQEKQQKLAVVQANVAALQKTCDETVAERDRLQAESDITAKRLVRAEKLTNGLNSEGVRWREAIVSLAQEKTNLIGDSFLSCAAISYYGSFTGSYRDGLVNLWLQKISELSIPASATFSLVNTLGNPVQIREWQTQGLPTDAVSVNNAILVDRCRRWPLMIDPQMQANAWLRKKEAAADLAITTMRDPNLLRTLENCVRLGRPLLLEDVGEHIEPALEPILQKAIFKNGGRMLIRLGDSDVDYNSNFRLYMTSKLPNPHYYPEVCIKVTVINFTVTMEGLEAQLLGLVVRTERPDIESKRVGLMLQMAEDKRELAALEERILRMLSESEGNILDDDQLINTLSDSKVTALAIEERVGDAEVTENVINEARSRYEVVATRGSIIYFVVADLALVDPMYQYSLSYYTSLFQRCIVDSEASNDLETRLMNIVETATAVIFRNICRGLFEKDKLLFSASIAFQILRQRGEILDSEWQLFMRGPGVVDRSQFIDNPHPSIFGPGYWDILCAAEQRVRFTTVAAEGEPPAEGTETAPLHMYSTANPFDGLTESLNTDYAGRSTDSAWSRWMESPDPLTAPLPKALDNRPTAFQRLILVKALREDKLQTAIASFVAMNLGASFAESPSASMEDIYRNLDCRTPCIFVLSTGADPTNMLLRFAKKMDYADRLSIVSLGQGQGPFARALIEKGVQTGDWVVLQNCMLAKSWMPELDRLVFEIQERAAQPDGGGVNPDFRLYLTSAPAAYFPISVLQNGVKMTNEPPKGFRANLQRSYANLVKPEEYEEMPSPLEWKKILAGLAFFHANIQERRKFGPLGWNIRYAFDESDLETSIAVLRRFLLREEPLPWDALNYVTGQINYGGRVTDDWDRRCLMSVLSIYLSPDILSDDYVFSRSGTYRAPPVGPLADTITYLANLPAIDDPEVFGMHENANVTFTTNESLALMGAILALQPRSTGGGGGKTSDDIVVELATSFESQCPELLLEEHAGPTTFVVASNGLLPSLAICLQQEMFKFNRLVNVMSTSLRDLKRAIHGLIVMSSDLDAMYTSFLNNQLPAIWDRVSFATLKSLGSWVIDLLYRMKFMRTWLTGGQPAAFPLPVFFFPQGFMTASLQTFARKYLEAIDALSFRFDVLTTEPEAITEAPEDGVIVYGLYLEGARFDRETGVLADSRPGEMYDALPAIHFIPAVSHRQAPCTYACPVYKTAVRKGVLSTTGMSTNFVLPVELPIAPTDTEQKYILAGVAALCNLTD